MQPTKIKSIVSHYTAGPWQRHYSSSTPDEWVIGGEGFAPVIAFVTRDEEDDMPGATVEANARLITAAPDLLEAVKAAHVQRDPRHRVSMLVNDWQRIEAAVAKAEGQQS